MTKSKNTKDVKITSGSKSEKDSKPKIPEFIAKLKNFEELKKEYELFEDVLTPIIILRKQAETLELYLKTIQQLIQPEDFNSLHECSAFDDASKSKMFDLYKQGMICYREILKAEVLNEEKNCLTTIQFAHEEIMSLKPEMLKIVDKMKESWRKDLKKGSLNYFG